MQNLKINAQRLWDTLMETANFGRTMKGGINRLTLTDDDRQVRDWFRKAAEPQDPTHGPISTPSIAAL